MACSSPLSSFSLQGLIDALLALHAILAGEFGTDHDRFEVVSVAVEGKVLAVHPGADDLFYLVGVHHVVQALSFQPCFSRRRVSRDTAVKQARTTARLVSGATSETPKKP